MDAKDRRIAELEAEIAARKEANDLLEKGCITLAAGYMAMRLKKCEERLDEFGKYCLALDRRLKALEDTK